jgi:SAM-dependent methyltransferase
MDRETEQFVRGQNYPAFHVLEISGAKWKDFGFASYEIGEYPAYDVCKGPLRTSAFDLVIAEQVLEHVLWPFRAVRHVFEMLRPGGIFLVTTPFLLRIHNHPVDCSRWTEVGIKHLLAEGGFSLNNITTGAWGNRACIRANFPEWKNWTKSTDSLENEPDFPVVVWAFARKSS